VRAPALAFLLALPVLADEFGDLERQAKDREYGAYWDRTAAFGKLAKLNSVKAAQVVLPHCGDEEPAVREFAALAIADFTDGGAVGWIAVNAGSLKSAEGRATAFWALGVSGRSEYLVHLERATSGEKDGPARAMAVRALAMYGDKAPEAPFVDRLKDPHAAVKAEAAAALAARRSNAGADALVKLLSDKDWEPRAAALHALAAGHPDRFREALPASQKDKAFQIRLAACEAALELKSDEGFAAATLALNDEAWQVRAAAVQCLYVIWEERSIEPLIARLDKEKGRIRLDIAATLRALTGKEIGINAADWRLWWESNKGDFKLGKKPKEKNSADVKMGGSGATFYDIPVLSDRVGFTIDYSGSMQTEEDASGGGSAEQKGKRKLEIALDEFQKTVQALGNDVKLNLVVLSTEAIVQKLRMWQKSLVQVDQRGKAMVIGWARDADKKLKEIKRGRGDIWDALMDLYADEGVDTIFLLSDGRPTSGACIDEKHFLSELARVNRYRKIQIHTVLTGTKGIDKKFMKEIADLTGGQAVAK
jgi:hypothetical protein